MIEPIFRDSVPLRHREYLEDQYISYYRDNLMLMRSMELQIVLSEWVGCGNDPYVSNRYGFYDCETQKYLDFLNGERKVCQLLEIMTGSRPPARCGFNQYGEPRPYRTKQAWSSADVGPLQEPLKQAIGDFRYYLESPMRPCSRKTSQKGV